MATCNYFKSGIFINRLYLVGRRRTKAPALVAVDSRTPVDNPGTRLFSAPYVVSAESRVKSCIRPWINSARGISFINTRLRAVCSGEAACSSLVGGGVRRVRALNQRQRCARADDIHRRGGAPSHLARAAAHAPSRLPASICWKCKCRKAFPFLVVSKCWKVIVEIICCNYQPLWSFHSRIIESSHNKRSNRVIILM